MENKTSIKKVKRQLYLSISVLVILLSLVIVLAFSSCSQWLDVQPEDGVTREIYWKTKEEVRAAVFGCYSQMLSTPMLERYFIWGESRADMAKPGPTASDNIVSIYNGEIVSTNVYSDWAAFYTAINQCNTVIELAPVVLDRDESFSEQQLQEYIAEVTCIRSLMYFYLVRTFRDVPYYETAYIYDYQNFSLPKTDGKTIIDNLIASLEAVEQSIPVSHEMTAAAAAEGKDPNKGRFNYYSWATLLADICLWKGDYDKCLTYTDRVMKSGQYSLVPVNRIQTIVYNIDTGRNDTIYEVVQTDVAALFKTMYADGNSVESIFELQNPATYNNPFAEMFNGNSYGSSRSFEVNSENFIPEYFPYSDIDRVWRDIRTEGVSYVGKYIWKWVGLDAMQTPTIWRTLNMSNGNWIFYRYADVMLMRAETLIQQSMGNNDPAKLQEALGLIKEIRARGNAPESTDPFYNPAGTVDALNAITMEEYLLDERCREFAFEGKRWFDLLRHAQRDNFSERTMTHLLRMALIGAPPEKVTIIQSKWLSNSGSLYMPISAGELQRNKNLQQNDFYAIPNMF